MRHLDDVQDEYFHSSPLSGDRWVEFLATSRPTFFTATPLTPQVPADTSPAADALSLDGRWMMRPHTSLSGEISQNDWPSTWMHWPAAGGPAWWNEGVDRSEWAEVELPATVQAALYAAGELEDPNWGANTADELIAHGEPSEWPWQFRLTRIEQSDWWLAKTFRLPDGWSGSSIELRFEGVAYSASFYLNGVPLGHHSGMFGGPTVDVSGIIRPDEDNLLVVRVDRAPDHWYGKPVGSAGFGWHYGHLIPIGIWRPVTLRRLDPVQLRDLRVSTVTIEPGRAATVEVDFRIENPARVKGTVELFIEMECDGDRHAWSARVPIDPTHERFSTTVEVTEPRLWWPRGYGQQNLYDVRVSARPASGSDDELTSVLSARVGIRTAQMRSASGWTGETDYRWQLNVNGVDIYMKGANWCALDAMLRPSESKYARVLQLCADANIQVLRAWGAGIVEDDLFYDICDRLGILVYQEFPFAWGPPDAPHSDLAVIDRQVLEIAGRLHRHPSLFMWGGGNENAEAVGADEVLTLVGRRIRQLDPGRPFHRTSPWGGNDHNYRVYHEGRALDGGYSDREAVLLGEWGLPSLPSLDSMRRYLPPASLEVWPPAPDDRAVLQHQAQFSLHDFVKQARYASYGPIRSWQEMVDFTQVAQAEVLRLAANRLRGQPVGSTTGFWFYKVSDLFPGNSWAVVDYYGKAKAAYYMAARVCRNLTAFLSTEQTGADSGTAIEAEVWAANDTAREAEIRVRSTVFDDRLETIHESVLTVPLPAGERREVERLVIAGDVHRGGVVLVRVAVSMPDGEESDDWYWFNARSETPAIRALADAAIDDLRARDAVEILRTYAHNAPSPLRELPRTDLSVFISAERGEVVVRNLGSHPAILLVVEGRGRESLTLSDNWFCLGAAETRRLTVEPSELLEAGGIRVRGWNTAAALVDVSAS